MVLSVLVYAVAERLLLPAARATVQAGSVYGLALGSALVVLVASLRGSVTIPIVTHNLVRARRLADDVVVFWNRDGMSNLERQGRSLHLTTIRPRPSAPVE